MEQENNIIKFINDSISLMTQDELDELLFISNEYITKLSACAHTMCALKNDHDNYIPEGSECEVVGVFYNDENIIYHITPTVILETRNPDEHHLYIFQVSPSETLPLPIIPRCIYRMLEYAYDLNEENNG